MLPEEEVQIWLKHLQTVTENHKHGASKATKIKRQQAEQECVEDNQELYTCGGLYEEENWVGCDRCNAWTCVNIFSELS